MRDGEGRGGPDGDCKKAIADRKGWDERHRE